MRTPSSTITMQLDPPYGTVTNIPSTLFCLLSVWVYLRAHAGDQARSRLVFLSWCAFLFALFFKPIAVPIALLLLLLDVYPLARIGGATSGFFARSTTRIWIEK